MKISKKLARNSILASLVAMTVVACGKQQTGNQNEGESTRQRITPTRVASSDLFYERGGDSSGGGPGIVCRNSAGEITSVQILDLYEASILNGISIPASSGTLDDYLAQIENSLSFDEAFRTEFKANVKRLQNESIHLPAGVSLQVSTDIGKDQAIPIQSGCTLEAVGFYDKTRGLVIATSTFEKLSARDQAAFYAHEVFYFLDRAFSGAIDSSRTRRLNGILFSNHPDPTTLSDLSKTMRWSQPYQHPIVTETSLADGLIVQITGNSDGYQINYALGCVGRYTEFVPSDLSHPYWIQEFDGFREWNLSGVINQSYTLKPAACGKLVLWDSYWTKDQDPNHPSPSGGPVGVPTTPQNMEVPDTNFSIHIKVSTPAGTVLLDQDLKNRLWAEIPIYSF